MQFASVRVVLLLADEEWWRSAVVYQVYPRSFADGDGDGVGDIAGGIRARLGYLAELGVDALWINPWYPSPMKDAGYDVADFRGTSSRCSVSSSRPRRCSTRHTSTACGCCWTWCPTTPPISTGGSARRSPPSRARPSGPGSCSATAVGSTAREPPNDWQSAFGGPGAWTRVAGSDGEPAQWYLHLFAPGQPDLNWANTGGRREFEEILGFWFDRGVDGFRIDVAHGLVKEAGARRYRRLLSMRPAAEVPSGKVARGTRPGTRRVHDGIPVMAADRREFAPQRIFTGEVWVRPAGALARYLRSTNCTPLSTSTPVVPWQAGCCAGRSTSDRVAAEVGAPPTWVLSNHDVTRTVTRYARPQPEDLTRLTVSESAEGPARLGARPAPRPRGGVADAGPAGQCVRLPGRRARTGRGRGHPRGAAAGSDLRAERGDRARSGRLPRAAAVVG